MIGRPWVLSNEDENIRMRCCVKDQATPFVQRIVDRADQHSGLVDLVHAFAR